MPSVKTGPDSLGIYLTNSSQYKHQADVASSLGGYAAVNRLSPMQGVITGAAFPSPLRSLRIDEVSGSALHASGAIGKIYCTAADTYAYKAPGESSLGTAMVITAGNSGVLQAYTDVDSYVIVTREGSASVPATADPLVITLYNQFNNVLGQASLTHAQRAAGRVSHRAVMFHNHHASDSITNLKVWQDSGNYSLTAIAKEAPVSLAIQTIATETTVPAGLSWNTGTTSGTGLDIGTLAAGEQYGVWIRRTITAGDSAGSKYTIKLKYSFTANAVNYTRQWTGFFRSEDTSANIYRLYAAIDTAPTYGATVATSATLPFTYALAPGVGDRSYNLVCRYLNEYRLESQNIYHRTKTISNTGAVVSSPLTTPTDLAVTNTQGGKLLVSAKYAHQSDDPAGEYFDIYWADSTDTLNASTNADLESVLTTVKIDPHSPGAAKILRHEIGPFAYGATIQVALKSRVSSPTLLESALTSIVSTEVTTHLPSRIRNKAPYLALANSAYSTQFTQGFEVVTVVDAPNAIQWRQQAGWTALYEGSNIILKFIHDDDYTANNGLWTPLAYEQIAISGAATGPIEVQSWTGPSKILNWTVNGQRTVKLNYTGTILSCASIEAGSSDYLKTTVATDPIKELGWKSMIQVFNATTNNFKTVASLDDDGVLCVLGGVNFSVALVDIP